MDSVSDDLPFYDRRRALEPVPGLPREFLGTAVASDYLIPLVSDPEAMAALRTDDMVVPANEDREGYYGSRHLEYWLSGYYDCQQIVQLVAPTSAHRIAYLDFGGCSGRVARHVARNEGYETWLCDINANYIDWLDRHCVRDIRSFQNRPFPSLPFTAESFDLVSAFSVFTHIAEGELQWILEMRRILKPGGFLYLTVLDEATWSFVRTQEWLIKSIARGVAESSFRKDLEKELPASRYVIRYADADAYNCNIFYKRDYIEKKWGNHFRSVRFVPMGHSFHTCAIFQK